MKSIDILKELVAFPSVSSDSNLALIRYVQTYLEGYGIEVQLAYNEEGTKANLYATIGPNDRPGIMLSGHTDVVPVAGQDWSTDPFNIMSKNGRVYGRGTADMKGFIACVLANVSRIDQVALKTPIHIALSYDEEIGCVGVRRLIDMLEQAPIRPEFCIVGEPTSMQIVRAHKGKVVGRIRCVGAEAHSSLAPSGLNAIYMANDMISAMRQVQDEIIANGVNDSAFEVPYTTLHVGVIHGGTALNIVPNHCYFDFEIRHLPNDSAADLLEKLEQVGEELLSQHREKFPNADIAIDITNSYPAMDTGEDSEIIRFVKSLTGLNACGKITFGTEGGLFTERLGIQSIVFGPGSIEQAHKPDEFIELNQLDQCDQFLDKLTQALS